MLLRDKIAVIVGATGTIGRTITQKVAENGALVIINFHQDEWKGLKTLELVEKAGGKGSLYQCDVTNLEELAKLFEHCNSTYGRIDILVYATGGPFTMKDVVDTSSEEWQACLELSLTGFFNCVKCVLPYMRQQKWGRIIALGSAGADLPHSSSLIVWDVSKTALSKFVRSLAVTEIQHGITCNIVNPSVVMPSIYFSEKEKQLIETIFPLEAQERMKESIPARRLGRAEEIADVVVFLASDQAGFITGNSINVTGGLGI